MWHETQRIFVDSAQALLRAAARVLPSVLAMLLLIGVFALLAVVARLALLRSCERLGLDGRLRQWGIASPPVAGGSGPSAMAARAVFWTVLLVGLLVGLSVLETTATAALSARLLEYVPRALVALAIVTAGLVAARVIARNVLIGAVNMGLQSARLLALGARWLAIVLAVAIALDHAGVGTSVVPLAVGILFGGIALALALAVGLGARDLVARSLARRFEGCDAPPGRAEKEEGRGQVHHL